MPLVLTRIIALVRSELYRMATIRSSWISLAAVLFLAAAFGALNPYGWALFCGVGTFGISVLTITRHYQHRTAALLYLAQPKRIPVLLALVLTTVVVTWVITALSGITMLAKGGDFSWYKQTLTLVPVMAVFGASLATIVRRPSWLLIGFSVWFIFVEGLLGKLAWELPITAFLQAAQKQAIGEWAFPLWALVALAVAVPTLARDVTGD